MPLKYQILLPMAMVTLATVAALSLFGVVMADRRANKQVHDRVTEIAQTLEASPFPLTRAVLEQIRGLTGAELLTTREDDSVLTGTIPTPSPWPPPSDSPLSHFSVAGAPYLASQIELSGSLRGSDTSARRLWVLFPESAYSERWLQAFWPPMVVGGLALMAVVMLAFVVHRRISQPLEQLRGQVERVAEGDFKPMPLPTRQDEVRSLAESVNRMAQMLAESERQVRQTERARTLGQLGGGLAHHLRNSVTGAQIALDLHRQVCEADADSLDMIQRQLILMESYLQRFLRIGDQDQSSPQFARCDLGEMLRSMEIVVRPRAHHVHVQLEMKLPQAPVDVWGDASELEQTFLNLIFNAIEAASETHVTDGDVNLPHWVHVHLSAENGNAKIVVEDNGSGPSEAVAQQLFEPFVSDKAEGVGLGLAVAQKAVRNHHGEIQWERIDDQTRFIVTLPISSDRKPSGSAASESLRSSTSEASPSHE